MFLLTWLSFAAISRDNKFIILCISNICWLCRRSTSSSNIWIISRTTVVIIGVVKCTYFGASFVWIVCKRRISRLLCCFLSVWLVWIWLCITIVERWFSVCYKVSVQWLGCNRLFFWRLSCLLLVTTWRIVYVVLAKWVTSSTWTRSWCFSLHILKRFKL